MAGNKPRCPCEGNAFGIQSSITPQWHILRTRFLFFSSPPLLSSPFHPSSRPNQRWKPMFPRWMNAAAGSVPPNAYATRNPLRSVISHGEPRSLVEAFAQFSLAWRKRWRSASLLGLHYDGQGLTGAPQHYVYVTITRAQPWRVSAPCHLSSPPLPTQLFLSFL